MRLAQSFLPLLALALSGLAGAASSWTFGEASLSLQGKGSGVGGAKKETLTPNQPLSEALTFDAGDKLKILLTTLDGKKAKPAHQVVLTLADASTALAESFSFTVKDNGKAKLELTHKDLPLQFLTTASPLHATITIASFGSSNPYTSRAFTLTLTHDPAAPRPQPPPATRYSALPEIHHAFRADPTSPPVPITLVFALAVGACLPLLLGAWLVIGANAGHLRDAFAAAPLSHAAFAASVVALEGVFALYYVRWNLFQVLPAAAAAGGVAFLSGSRALSEVQARRFAGKR